MAGVPDDELPRIGPWPLGVTNIHKPERVPATALVEGVNIDFDRLGWPSLRPGRTKRVDATLAHSLFNVDDRLLLAWVDGDWNAYARNSDRSLTLIQTIASGLGDIEVTAAQYNRDIFWSNGQVLRRFNLETMQDYDAVLPTPPAPAYSLSNNGGLAAGQYLVTLTWRTATGYESAASAPIQAVVPDGGGVLLNLPAAPTDAATTIVWATPPNGDAFYYAYELPASATTLLLGRHLPGPMLDPMATELVPLRPGTRLRKWQGRLLSQLGPWLSYSEPLRPALMHHSNIRRFGDDITLMEPVGDGNDGSGVFVADQVRTWFNAGPNPDKWQTVVRYRAPAVPGTSRVVPGHIFKPAPTTSDVAVWLAKNGVLVRGLPGGVVEELTDQRIVVPEASEGALAFRELKGIRQIITSMLTGAAQAFSVSDSAAATVRRNGVSA